MGDFQRQITKRDLGSFRSPECEPGHDGGLTRMPAPEALNQERGEEFRCFQLSDDPLVGAFRNSKFRLCEPDILFQPKLNGHSSWRPQLAGVDTLDDSPIQPGLGSQSSASTKLSFTNAESPNPTISTWPCQCISTSALLDA